jgi:hypothetical protein
VPRLGPASIVVLAVLAPEPAMFDELWNAIIDRWWGRILFGVLFLLIAWFVYWFVGVEEARGNVRLWILIVAHWIGGRLCAASCIAIPGVLLIGLGLYSLLIERED